MNCHRCKKACVKKGFTQKGQQRYYCKSCKKHQQASYVYNAWREDRPELIVLLMLEGLGIRSIARVLRITPNTVISQLYKAAEKVNRPLFYKTGGAIEIDELWTYIGRKKKDIWIAYALDRKTGRVIDYRIGNRSKKTIRPVVESALLADPEQIFTDKWSGYPALIPSGIHRIHKRKINKIERMNLALRTQLKRLNRTCLPKR